MWTWRWINWIQPLQDNALPTDIQSSIHVVFLCCPRDLAIKIGYELSEEGIAVVDLTGALGETIGFSLGGLADKVENFQSHRMISLPSPSTAALARVWEVLHSFQPIQLSSVVSVSASRFGQQGIEELAKQVRGLLNFQEAPQVLFPDGLAFDMFPAIGTSTSIGHPESQLSTMPIFGVRTQSVSNSYSSGVDFLWCFDACTNFTGNNPVLEEVLETLTKSELVECRQQLQLRSVGGEAPFGRPVDVTLDSGCRTSSTLDNVFLQCNALTIVHQFHSMDVLCVMAFIGCVHESLLFQKSAARRLKMWWHRWMNDGWLVRGQQVRFIYSMWTVES